MYRGKSVSVILPTYNEKDSIRKVIEDFEQLGVVDEILVINNNAAEGTSEQVAPTTATEIFETLQGYGAAIQCGFRHAKGDLIAVCEPDDTFVASDLHKLLAYSDDLDIVYGSRTVKNLIWEKANMGFLLKWGNWGVAKIVEVLFNTNYLSDVGCTFRVIRRQALQVLMPHFRIRTNFFGPEMMVLGYKKKLRSLQIPVNYRERIGVSSVTGDLKKAVVLGLKMVVLIVVMRLGLEKAVYKLPKEGS